MKYLKHRAEVLADLLKGVKIYFFLILLISRAWAIFYTNHFDNEWLAALHPSLTMCWSKQQANPVVSEAFFFAKQLSQYVMRPDFDVAPRGLVSE